MLDWQLWQHIIYVHTYTYTHTHVNLKTKWCISQQLLFLTHPFPPFHWPPNSSSNLCHQPGCYGGPELHMRVLLLSLLQKSVEEFTLSLQNFALLSAALAVHHTREELHSYLLRFWLPWHFVLLSHSFPPGTQYRGSLLQVQLSNNSNRHTGKITY